MIHLTARVKVVKLTGQVATVPKEIGAKLQIKRVEPAYHEQTVTYDEDYDGLNYVIVGAKPRPLQETFLTDMIAENIISTMTTPESSLVEEPPEE